MTGDCHAGICGSPGVRFPRATQPASLGTRRRITAKVERYGATVESAHLIMIAFADGAVVDKPTLWPVRGIVSALRWASGR